MTIIQEQVFALQQRILDEQYYVQHWLRALAYHGCSPEVVDFCDDATLVDVCQTMWEDLPDDQAIRRGPFFLLCDVAEHIFDEENDEEEEE